MLVRSRSAARLAKLLHVLFIALPCLAVSTSAYGVPCDSQIPTTKIYFANGVSTDLVIPKFDPIDAWSNVLALERKLEPELLSRDLCVDYGLAFNRGRLLG